MKVSEVQLNLHLGYSLTKYMKIAKCHHLLRRLRLSATMMVKVRGFFRLRNVNIVGFPIYLIATCFGHTTETCDINVA
jgi:hypothetical protein